MHDFGHRAVMMDMFRHLCVSPTMTIAQAVDTLQRHADKICLVVADDDTLLGTITDGDIRRGLLRSVPLDAPAREVMFRTPRVAGTGANQSDVRDVMAKYLLHHMPVVDDAGRLVGLIRESELNALDRLIDNWVVLMAGGLGERLRPLTESTPKPLLRIGDKPLLQSILESFVEQGFRNFFISVNYQAERVKEHFGDGSVWGANIQYLEETQRMGTAGALSLLPERPTRPMIVMNGDLITRTGFRRLLEFHKEQKSAATMCVREYDFQVPFGVINLDGDRIKSIHEKPIHRFFVNAGIYVLDPILLTMVPNDQRFDMTQLFETVIAEDRTTAVFPIHEYWLDIGRFDDLEQAQVDYRNGAHK